MGKRKVLEMKGLLGRHGSKRENWVALGAAAEKDQQGSAASEHNKPGGKHQPGTCWELREGSLLLQLLI